MYGVVSCCVLTNGYPKERVSDEIIAEVKYRDTRCREPKK